LVIERLSAARAAGLYAGAHTVIRACALQSAAAVQRPGQVHRRRAATDAAEEDRGGAEEARGAL